jgi:hypothetical protein
MVTMLTAGQKQDIQDGFELVVFEDLLVAGVPGHEAEAIIAGYQESLGLRPVWWVRI